MSSGFVHELQLTPNLALISTTPRCLLGGQPPQRFSTYDSLDSTGEEYRLCIMIGWFLGKKHHIMKYAQFYLDQDFDVLLYNSTPNQILKPVTSPKNMARDVLEFCQNNQQYAPIVLHSFSVGAMGWGYLLDYVNRNPEKYNFLHDKIIAQVWDSPFINIERLPEVGGFTAFPNNRALRKVVKNYLTFHMKFHDTSSKYYRAAAEGFQHFNTKTNFLVFTSENDSIALCSAVAKCAEEWQNSGSKVYWKIWQRSTHVCHLRENPEEYTTLLRDFLDRISLLKYPERFKILSNMESTYKSGLELDKSSL